MKLNEILNLSQTLNQIDLKQTNITTSYWVSRNIRVLKPTLESFEQFRKAATEDEWFKDYQEKSMKEPNEAKEEFKVQLELLDTEFNEKLNEEVEVKLFKINIDDLEVKPEIIPFILDLIIEA